MKVLVRLLLRFFFFQLQRREFSLANRCFLCQEEEEKTNHLLLLHCAVSRVLGSLLFSLFGIHWVTPLSVRDALLGWRASFVRKGWRIVWTAGPLCIFWTVWNARNGIVCRDEVLSIQKLKSSFVNLLFSEIKWFIEDGPTILVQFIDWVGVT